MAEGFPETLRYTESDEWVRDDGGLFTAGVTAYAAEQLGDVVYLQLPEVGKAYGKGEAFGEIESVKAVSDLYCPLAGEVAEINSELDQNAGLVNEDPYGAGWIVKLHPADPSELDSLLDAAAYERLTKDRA
jgi:glycine cleavage system H protein